MQLVTNVTFSADSIWHGDCGRQLAHAPAQSQLLGLDLHMNDAGFDGMVIKSSRALYITH